MSAKSELRKSVWHSMLRAQMNALYWSKLGRRYYNRERIRRRTLFGVVRRELGPVFRRLAEQKESRVEEGHILVDHVHMLLSIPPKHSVSSVVGYMKGKSAIHVARHFLKRERHYAGQCLWARGFFVDTVGRDTETIRRYIQQQEAEDQRIDQLELPIVKNQ
jgi:putative transposase